MKAPYETRLYVEQDLSPRAEVALQGDRVHYVRNVLRLGAGARVALFNGRDGEWLAEITAMAKHEASLLVLERQRPQQAEPDLWLVFAPLKMARLDYLVQKATELGASCLWPVFTRHTAVRRINTRRFAANAVEAAEQCGRLAVPVIREAAPLDAVLEAWPRERCLFCCDETGGGGPILEAIARQGPGPAAFLVGPEGGFADAELDRLDKLTNVCRVSLGPRLLRADTAAAAALACWQARIGDWVIERGNRDS